MEAGGSVVQDQSWLHTTSEATILGSFNEGSLENKIPVAEDTCTSDTGPRSSWAGPDIMLPPWGIVPHAIMEGREATNNLAHLWSLCTTTMTSVAQESLRVH